VRNSIRLILSALIISGVTWAVAGAPSSSSAQPSANTQAKAAPTPPVSFALLND